MKKIAIYDRYLSTIGGGERYSCRIAEILSKRKNFKVFLITDIFTDLKEVSERLNLDLSRVGLKIFPFISEDYAAKIARKYDLFINATYLSSLPGYSSKNIYLCYFPTPFDVDFRFIHKFLLIFFRLPAKWLFKLADKLGKGFSEIEVEEGLYEPRRFLLRRGSWSSGEVKLKVKKTVSHVRLGLKNPQKSSLDMMKVNIRALSEKTGGEKDSSFFYNKNITLEKGIKKTVEIPLDNRSSDKEIFITSGTFIPSEVTSGSKDSRSLGVVVYDRRKINFFKKIIFKVIGYIPLFLITFPRDLRFLETYHKIITISEYSRKWIKRLWNKESTILYPPVDTDSFKAKKKEKIILSVGRFFPEHHNKKQLELTEIFKRLVNKHPEKMKGYTLYLAGGVSRSPDHLAYLNKVITAGRGYAVEVIPNIKWEKLIELFERSFIFWHASGMEEDEEAHPEKFEHFGITTVEAMAAGCIPVVINKGGQKEIITDGFNGFLFRSREELENITMGIIEGKVNTERIRKNAIKDCRKFSDIKFEENLISIIKEVTADN